MAMVVTRATIFHISGIVIVHVLTPPFLKAKTRQRRHTSRQVVWEVYSYSSSSNGPEPGSGEGYRNQDLAHTAATDASAQTSEASKTSGMEWDPFENLFGLGLDMRPRPGVERGRGYVRGGKGLKEIPCPLCRGRGFLRCSECQAGKPKPSCQLCQGKGVQMCERCHGERVVWESFIDESTWVASNQTPLEVVGEEDWPDSLLDLSDNLRTPKVGRPHSPEVREKISVSMKAYERRTKVLSRRMRRIFQDPTLRAERIAAIKAGKANEDYRRDQSEKLKQYFAHPQHRLQRGLSLKGRPFHCRNCGEEGHRSHFCPLKGYVGRKRIVVRRNKSVYKCGRCGEKGHTRRSCSAETGKDEEGGEGDEKEDKGLENTYKRGQYRCRKCGKRGHFAKACTAQVGKEGAPAPSSSEEEILISERGQQPRPPYRRGVYKCGLCGQEGHVRRSCTTTRTARQRLCSVCKESGHTSRTCSSTKGLTNLLSSKEEPSDHV